MKNSIVIATVCVALITLISSCSDYLVQENPNKVAASSFFQTTNDVDRAVNGIYLALRSNSCMGEGSFLYTEERSDNMGRLDNQSNAGEPFQFTDFSLLPSNTYLKTHWAAIYIPITRANYVLTYIDNVVFTNNDQKENYKAEAKFVRALVYAQIVRKWGDVPLVTEYLTTEADINSNTFREKKETVYQQIITDLKDALASTLPNIQPEAKKGHACKAAVNVLLGEVYLTMAATITDNRQSNLENARTYLTAAYNMRKFGSLSEIPYADVFNVDKKSTCPEIIFQIVFKQGDKTYYSSIAADTQAKNETTNSLKKTNGAGMFVNPDLVKEYESDDLRKAWSVKYANDPVAKSWFITKFRDTSSAASALGYGGNDFILMRYADVILMLAEVNLYLGDIPAATNFLNEVRARSQRPLYAAMLANPDYSAKYPTLKLAILHERRVELAFENRRWFDLLRFFNDAELKAFMTGKSQDDYGISNLKNFGTKDRFYPIPFDEYKLNPEKMWQNPGY